VAVLIGYRGHIYTMQGDFGVTETASPFAAIGTGAREAMAVFMATEGQPARARLVQALEVSEALNAFVGGPFHIDTLEAV
jgi:ATP-dependent protease HslVU (ClpYQ) peptidase subunit